MERLPHISRLQARNTVREQVGVGHRRTEDMAGTLTPAAAAPASRPLHRRLPSNLGNRIQERGIDLNSGPHRIPGRFGLLLDTAKNLGSSIVPGHSGTSSGWIHRQVVTLAEKNLSLETKVDSLEEKNYSLKELVREQGAQLRNLNQALAQVLGRQPGGEMEVVPENDLGRNLQSPEQIDDHLVSAELREKCPSQLRKPFRCQYNGCSKRYVHKAGLDTHVRAGHKGIRYPCEFCGASFKFRYECRRHERIHREGLPLEKCLMCGKEFRTVAVLKAHLKIQHAAF